METAGQDGNIDEGADGSPAPGENRLLFSDAMREGRHCLGVSGAGAADDVACLVVSLNDPVDAVVDGWRRHGHAGSGELAVVSVGETTRSAAAVAGSGSVVELTDDVKTTTVSDASDLTGLGIRISECLKAWSDREEVVVCFDSLTSLLQFSDVKRVFQFLHVLTSRFHEVDARAHFHIAPAAHDDQTIATLRSLFDGTYERTDDGDWREV